jgi:hypothetical protein
MPLRHLIVLIINAHPARRGARIPSRIQPSERTPNGRMIDGDQADIDVCSSALKSSALICMKATDSCRPGTFRKTSLLRDRSNGDAVRRQPTNPQRPQPLAVTYPRERGIATARSRARAGRLCTVPDFRPGGLGAISSSRCQTTRTRWGEPRAGANRCTSGRAAPPPDAASRKHARAHTRQAASKSGHCERINSDRTAAGLVEPDGIEPTTSCLQSRRSPN